MLHSKVVVGRSPEELEERLNDFFENNGVGSNAIITLKFSTFVASKDSSRLKRMNIIRF